MIAHVTIDEISKEYLRDRSLTSCRELVIALTLVEISGSGLYKIPLCKPIPERRRSSSSRRSRRQCSEGTVLVRAVWRSLGL